MGPYGNIESEERGGSESYAIEYPPLCFMKSCRICKENKPLIEFKKMTGGWKSPYCNKCRLEYAKKQNQKRSKLRKQKLW